MTANPIPDGYHSVTPYLIIDGAADALAFYERAFGAEEVLRFPSGDKIAHAEIRIGDSIVMLADEFPDMGHLGPKSRGGSSVGLMIYLADVDAAFAKALAAGATELKPLQDQFYGDRSGSVTDPFGHQWTLATHVEDVSEEEMQRRMAAMRQGEKAEEPAEA
jgi:PhnB protein